MSENARKRMADMETRVVGAVPPMSYKLHDYADLVRVALGEALAEGRLVGAPREMMNLFRVDKAGGAAGYVTCWGGDRVEQWEEGGQFERDDGARFNFNFTVLPAATELELIAYNFNVAWRPGVGDVGGRFVRFDWDVRFRSARKLLGSPPLSHVHLGRHGIVSPTPVMSPLEVLDLVLWHELVTRPPVVSERSSA